MPFEFIKTLFVPSEEALRKSAQKIITDFIVSATQCLLFDTIPLWKRRRWQAGVSGARKQFLND